MPRLLSNQLDQIKTKAPLATHMLENGADTRHSPANLVLYDTATTEIYTQVSVAQLKKVCQKTHPGQQVESASPAEAILC